MRCKFPSHSWTCTVGVTGSALPFSFQALVESPADPFMTVAALLIRRRIRTGRGCPAQPARRNKKKKRDRGA